MVMRLKVDSLERTTDSMVQGEGPKRLPASPKTVGRPVRSMATIEVRFASRLDPQGRIASGPDGRTNLWIRPPDGHDDVRITAPSEVM